MDLEPWQQDLQQAIRTVDELEKFLPNANRETITAAISRQRFSLTRHTANLIDWNDPNDPLLLMSIPHAAELIVLPEELMDPIGDVAKSPVPFLTHRYPDRALVYTTFACAQYCRFCFRRRRTGCETPGPSLADRERMVEYLTAHPEIGEVVISGGDVLILTDQQVDEWLTLLRRVPTVRRIRLHSRIPVVMPSRITPSLIEVIKKHQHSEKPVFVITHFNHANELAPENVAALERLADAGITVRNQNVLLKGVNDNAATLKELYMRLTDCRCMPMYIYQADLAEGTNRFRVPMERGMQIMAELQGHASGLAIPKYILDLPGGMGKIPMQKAWLTKEDDGIWRGTGPLGDKIEYVEPPCT